MSRTLTMGYRCCIERENYAMDVNNHDCILLKRSRTQGSISWAVMVLGKSMVGRKLKKPFKQEAIWGRLAWINEDDMRLVDANIATNIKFADWASDVEDCMCPDCYYFEESFFDDSKERVCPKCKCEF